jgi:LmeA-like phospholipid-binding
MRKLLIALVVLAVLFIAADRIGAAVAANQISDRLAATYGLPEKPGVTITGFPFLTQVASGNYQQIDVSASQVQADGATLHDLNVRLMGVHAPISAVFGSSSSTVTADRAAGSALVDFATVQRRLPHGFRLAPDGGNLMVSGQLSYHGISVPVSATVTLAVSGAGIRVTPKDVTIADGLSLPGSYVSQLHTVVPLGNFPLHLHLTSVQVTPDGLRVGAAARNVQFAGTG